MTREDEFKLVVEAKEYAFTKLDGLSISKEIYSEIFKVVYKAYIDGVESTKKEKGE